MLMVVLVCGLVGARAELWEYRLVRLFPDSEEAQLNNLGAQGWELVTAMASGDFAFKRVATGKYADGPDLTGWLYKAQRMKSQVFGVTVPYHFGLTKAGPIIWLRQEDLQRSQYQEDLKGLVGPGIPSVAVWAIRSDRKQTGVRIGEITAEGVKVRDLLKEEK